MTTPDRLRELAAASEPRADITSLFFLSPGDDVTELLLIRHAQVEASALGTDPALTDLGQEQAEVLAQYLAHGRRIEAVYASPTRRARETAEPLARMQSLEVETLDGLRDIEVRRRFDKPFREILAEEFGEANVNDVLQRVRIEARIDALAPLLEESASFNRRTGEALEGLLQRHPGQRIAVVTHGPVIMAYTARLLGSSRDFAFKPKLTSMTLVLAREEQRTVDFVNATPHFHAL